MLTKIRTITQINTALASSPIVLVERGSATVDEIHAIAKETGGQLENSIFGSVRTLRVEKTINRSVGSSSSAHPPHTDGCYIATPPSHIILQCVRPDRHDGGIGLFWDINLLIQHMPEPLKEALLRTPMTFARQREDGQTIDAHQGFILNWEAGEFGPMAIRWRFDERLRPKVDPLVSKQEVELFDSAIAYVNNFFQTEAPIRIRYKKGDILVASNRYLTHGRTRILDPNRMLRRAWLRLAG